MSKNTTNQTRTCNCGCGQAVAGKAIYRPGHDARHVGMVARDDAASLLEDGYERLYSYEDLGSQKLINKAHAMADRIVAKATGAKQPTDRKSKQDAAPIDTGHEGYYGPVIVDRDDADEADETLVKPVVAISTIRGEAVDPMWEETPEGDKAEAFEVKIGRWTYPAKHLLGMDVRNTKRDGSGEWIPYTAS